MFLREILPPGADRARMSQRALVAVKVIHTMAWFSIESCVVYLLYSGFARRTDRRAAVAAAVVGGETLIFAANGFRCPLTDVAESLGADDGSVTDIFLPRRFARALPAIHVPLILLTAWLHRRNVRDRRSAIERESDRDGPPLVRRDRRPLEPGSFGTAVSPRRGASCGEREGEKDV
jgi:hypothetical protein